MQTEATLLGGFFAFCFTSQYSIQLRLAKRNLHQILLVIRYRGKALRRTEPLVSQVALMRFDTSRSILYSFDVTKRILNQILSVLRADTEILVKSKSPTDSRALLPSFFCQARRR